MSCPFYLGKIVDCPRSEYAFPRDQSPSVIYTVTGLAGDTVMQVTFPELEFVEEVTPPLATPTLVVQDIEISPHQTGSGGNNYGDIVYVASDGFDNASVRWTPGGGGVTRTIYNPGNATYNVRICSDWANPDYFYLMVQEGTGDAWWIQRLRFPTSDADATALAAASPGTIHPEAQLLDSGVHVGTIQFWKWTAWTSTPDGALWMRTFGNGSNSCDLYRWTESGGAVQLIDGMTFPGPGIAAGVQSFIPRPDSSIWAELQQWSGALTTGVSVQPDGSYVDEPCMNTLTHPANPGVFLTNKRPFGAASNPDATVVAFNPFNGAHGEVYQLGDLGGWLINMHGFA